MCVPLLKHTIETQINYHISRGNTIIVVHSLFIISTWASEIWLAPPIIFCIFPPVLSFLSFFKEEKIMLLAVTHPPPPRRLVVSL